MQQRKIIQGTIRMRKDKDMKYAILRLSVYGRLNNGIVVHRNNCTVKKIKDTIFILNTYSLKVKFYLRFNRKLLNVKPMIKHKK